MTNSNKIYVALAIVVMAVLAYIAWKRANGGTQENFLGNLPSMSAVVDTVVKSPSTMSSVQNTAGQMEVSNGCEADLGWVQYPGFQSQLSPRFDGTNSYGSQIRYNPPSSDNLAVPPSGGYGGVVSESYSTGDMTDPSNYAQISSDQGLVRKNMDDDVVLPISDMRYNSVSGESGAGDEQPIVFDRLMYSTRRTKLRAQGDPIRGDLPIVPCDASWFRPSVQPAVDLQQGAMQILNGDGSTQRSMEELIYKTSGGTDTTIGGLDMAPQLMTEYSGGLSDVSVTAFP